MVATDVASRGIGMIDRKPTPALFPFPLLHFPCRTSRSVRCVVWFLPSCSLRSRSANSTIYWSRLVIISFGFKSRSPEVSSAVPFASFLIPFQHLRYENSGGMESL